MDEEDDSKEEVIVPEIVENHEISTNKKVLQGEKGHWLPGTRNPNTIGKYRKKDPVKEYFKTLCGEDAADLFNTLVEIVYNSSNKDFRNKYGTWRPSERLKALELLLGYAVGKPRQNISAEIEQKIIQVNLDATPEDLKEEDIE